MCLLPGSCPVAARVTSVPDARPSPSGGRLAGGLSAPAASVPPMTDEALLIADDGRARCAWAGSAEDYVTYHDEEWGRPTVDERLLFEKLCLEGFQSGLSWITILRKREAFREVFAGFDPAAVATYGEEDVQRLLQDARIIRHRGKIEATIANARALLGLHDGGQTLGGLLWSHEPDHGPAPVAFADVPAVTPASTAFSKGLKARGFRFVGPTTAYAAMQAMGVVNDHLQGCWRREPCLQERAAATIPTDGG